MKFEKLSENRIKITVSGEDLDLWGISASSLVQNTPEAQEVYWYMIRKAETETGFSPGEARLLVEALPQKGTGIILFMTVLLEEGNPAETPRRAGGKKLRVRVPNEARVFLYEFEGFEDLCGCLRGLPERLPSSLYRLNRKYYLKVTAPERGEEHTHLREYGKCLEKAELSSAYLREHGETILVRDAVAQLKEYFN